MKNTVVIKSYKNGLAVYLDSEMEFSLLCEQVALKFKDSARFFGDMRVAVSFEGRELSAREENLLVDAICRNSSLNVVCVVGKDEKKDQMFLHKQPHQWIFYSLSWQSFSVNGSDAAFTVL